MNTDFAIFMFGIVVLCGIAILLMGHSPALHHVLEVKP